MEAGVAVLVLSALICTKKKCLGLQMLFMSKKTTNVDDNYCHAGNYGCQWLVNNCY